MAFPHWAIQATLSLEDATHCEATHIWGNWTFLYCFSTNYDGPNCPKDAPFAFRTGSQDDMFYMNCTWTRFARPLTQMPPMPVTRYSLGVFVIFGSAVFAQTPAQIDVVVHPVQAVLYGSSALDILATDGPATDFDFLVSPDQQQVRLVTRLRTYAVRQGRHFGIEKLTRRYEYLSPIIDVKSGYATPLLLATGSTGRMIMADLKLLMSESKSSGERRAFYGLDSAGEKTTLRGRVLYVDGVNAVYRDAEGNLYSVPTAE